MQFPEGAPPCTVAVLSSQFGITFPAGSNPMDVVAVHPTQLYETVMGCVMFAILWSLRKHRQKEGWLFGGYCVLAGLGRFIVEFFRAKDDGVLAGLTVAQGIGLTIFTIGIGLLLARRGRATRATV